MRFLRKLFKKEKRGIDLRDWVPLGISQSGGAFTKEIAALPQVKRAVNIFKDWAVNAPIQACNEKGDVVQDDLVDLLNSRPCRWLSKSEWFTKLCQDLLIEGNFFAHIVEEKGVITSLPPYPPQSVYVHARKSLDSSNPLEVQAHGYFYRTSYKGDDGKERSSIVNEDQILHLKSLWSNRVDSLNGVSLAEGFGETLSYAENILNCSSRLAANGMLPPSIVTGVEELEDEQRKALRDTLGKFFSGSENYLTLDTQKIESLMLQNPSVMIMNLSAIASIHISRLMNLPLALIDSETGSADTSAQGLRELHRWATRTAGRAFLSYLGERFSELSENTIKFSWRSAVWSDLREAGTSLPSLIDSGVLSKEEAREFVKD